jgi:branched-chain amino acid transport system ATP-binding protein
LQALRISHRAYVLEQGKVAMEGSSAALRSSDTIRQSYLGM